MAPIKIDDVTEQYRNEYRELVHHALKNDHECFRISPNDELDIPFEEKTDDHFTLGAFDNQKLIGVVSFKREGSNREKLRHKGLLSRMIVSSECRGQGIGKQLIAELIKRVKTVEGIEQINLTVIPTNEKAKLLYEKFGFKTFASEPNAIKWKGEYYTADQMSLPL